MTIYANSLRRLQIQQFINSLACSEFGAFFLAKVD
jgi:hypothetical protein